MLYETVLFTAVFTITVKIIILNGLAGWQVGTKKKNTMHAWVFWPSAEQVFQSQTVLFMDFVVVLPHRYFMDIHSVHYFQRFSFLLPSSVSPFSLVINQICVAYLKMFSFVLCVPNCFNIYYPLSCIPMNSQNLKIFHSERLGICYHSLEAQFAIRKLQFPFSFISFFFLFHFLVLTPEIHFIKK